MFSTRPLVVTLDDICFCHWPVDASALQRMLPSWLAVETIDGDAWVSAVAQTVTGVSSFGVGLTRPAEALTVRTYVCGPSGQRGVRFFAMFASDSMTSALSEPTLRLPVHSGMLSKRSDGGQRRRTLDVDGRRTLDLTYSPGDSDPTTARPDSLAGFLIERHRYFTSGPFGTRLVGSVGHDPWRLGTVEADVTQSLLLTLDLPDPLGDPLIHYSPGIEMGVAPPEPLWLA